MNIVTHLEDKYVKGSVIQGLGDEYLFSFHSAFIDNKGNVNPEIFKTFIKTKSEPIETYKEKLQVEHKNQKVNKYLEESDI